MELNRRRPTTTMMTITIPVSCKCYEGTDVKPVNGIVRAMSLGGSFAGWFPDVVRDASTTVASSTAESKWLSWRQHRQRAHSLSRRFVEWCCFRDRSEC